MHTRILFWIVLFALVLAACQPVAPPCTPQAITYQKVGTPFPDPTPGAIPVVPEQVEVGGKMMEFDQVIHGPLCNNTLRGKVYIACDITVAEWTDQPNFLDDCDFTVEPDTVIYVAAHNNTAYYKGCASCHMSSDKANP